MPWECLGSTSRLAHIHDLWGLATCGGLVFGSGCCCIGFLIYIFEPNNLSKQRYCTEALVELCEANLVWPGMPAMYHAWTKLVIYGRLGGAIARWQHRWSLTGFSCSICCAVPTARDSILVMVLLYADLTLKYITTCPRKQGPSVLFVSWIQ